MGILNNYRGFSIGKNLLNAALLKAKERGLTRIELTVREPNTIVIQLYEKFKFVIEGVKRKAIKLDNSYEDIILMGVLFE